MHKISSLVLSATMFSSIVGGASFFLGATAAVAQEVTFPNVAVAPEYDSTHVYVSPDDFDRFVSSFQATFGGTITKMGVFTVTPTPSRTMSQLIFSPVGELSVFGFKTPIPWPFGSERTGYMVTDMDKAIASARTAGADVIVNPFPDAIGRDAVIQWPGGVNMQIYMHNTRPNYKALQTIPENRVYVSADRVDNFVHDFLLFSHGKTVSDDAKAPGIEIGRPSDTYRRIRISSTFGKMVVLVTDGHLPYPYGREVTGYQVANLDGTLAKATAAGAKILVTPYSSDGRLAAVVQFPGGYVAEIHAISK
jgi:predicted enzyme related to lactoylglutathione lyase